MDFNDLISINLDVKNGRLIPKTFGKNESKRKNIPKITNDIWNKQDKDIYVNLTKKELGYINRGSDLGEMIYLLSNDHSNKTFLEIGTFNGYGSTRCFVEALINRLNKNYVFFSLETNPDKFRNSQALYFGLHNIHLLQEVIELNPLENIFDVFPILRNNKRQQYLFQVELNNIEFCSEFLKNPKIPEIFDVVLFNGGKYTDYYDFMKIKDRCRYVILVDINTNPSSKKIIQFINHENKNKDKVVWKKLMEFSRNSKNNHQFVIYFKNQ